MKKKPSAVGPLSERQGVTDETDRRRVRLDPRIVEAFQFKKNWNLNELVEKARSCYRISRATVLKAVKGELVAVHTAAALAKLLDTNLLAVLHPEILKRLRLPSACPDLHELFGQVGEWQMDECLQAVTTAPNGLKYDVWKLSHRHVPGRLARGKCYCLQDLATKERSALKAYLTRHSLVCDRVGPHPHIVQNRDAVAWEQGDMWWIIDEWIDGESLAQLLTCKRLDASWIPRVLREIAVGLQALHAQNIIRRELSPNYVWLRRNDGSVVLTDLELAKLLDRAPTVAPAQGWPDDGYRAVEVAPDQPLTPRADIYSWGRIAVEALCGFLPPKGEEKAALANIQLPPAVRQTLLKCVAPPASERPASIDEVLTAIKKWK